MNTLIKLIYQLRGYTGFYQDTNGRYHAYAPYKANGYWSRSADRRPLPMVGDLFKRFKRA